MPRLFRLLRPALLALMFTTVLLEAPAVFAQEYSSITGSTVLGRSFAVPFDREAGELALVAEMGFFFKTLEIFNLPDLEGETFTGYRTPLRLRYQPRHDLALELGALLGHDFGLTDRLNQTAPIMRLVYQPTPGLYILGGTLVPTHWIHDAFLDDVQKLRSDVEQGFQLRADQSWLKNDTWLNWRVHEGPIEAEEFEIGMSNQFRLPGDILRLDSQFMWTHAGGQISSSGRIEQNLIFLAGLSVGTTRPLGLDFCEEIRAGWAYLYSRDENDHTPLVKGFGRAYSLHADFRILPHFVMRGFAEKFYGDDFQATLGDPLYRLDKYDQLGTNLLFNVGGDHLFIEAGFVNQWTDDVSNLTYQLSMVWGEAFTLGRLKN